MSLRSLFAALTVSAVLMCPVVGATADEKPDPAKVEEGERVYGDYCQTCHGENLVNIGQTFDLRRLKPDERKRFDTSVQNGKGQMPPWRGVIDAEQMDNIWNFIMSKRS